MLKQSSLIRGEHRGRPPALAPAGGKLALEAGIEGLTFHDLRGTTVTRLTIVGCTAAEIGAITGHSMRDVAQILDAHYLGGKEQLARRAIEEAGGNRSGS